MRLFGRSSSPDGDSLETPRYAELSVAVMREANEVQEWVAQSANPSWLTPHHVTPELISRLEAHWSLTRGNLAKTEGLRENLEQLRGVTPSNQVLHKLHKQVIAVAETTLTYASLQRDIAAALGDGKNNKRVQQLIRKQAQVGMQLARHSAEIELIGEKLARESPNLARELKMIP